MTKLLASILAFALLAVPATVVTLVSSAPAHAQSNNNDYTPLGSRIRRDRQFPTGITNRYLGEAGSVTRKRNEAMEGQFSRCLYNRSHERALDFLARSDFGIYSFEQVALDTDRAVRVFGFQDCLRRVANSRNSGVSVNFTAPGLRNLLLAQAYLDAYPDGPDWVQPGHVIAERQFPLSTGNTGVEGAMALADCLVANDPYAADFYFRAIENSDEEARALEAIVPAISPCIPDGQEMELTKSAIRAWIGEGLWHASQHNSPPPAEEEQ